MNRKTQRGVVNPYAILLPPQRTLTAARQDGVDTSKLADVRAWLEERKRK